MIGDIRFRLDRDPPFPIDRKLCLCLKDGNVGRRYWERMVNDIEEDRSHRAEVIDYVLNYADYEQGGVGLFLHGPHGSGKTTLLSILLREALRRAPCSIWFTPISEIDWYARNRETLGPTGVPVWRLITRAQVVAIDDVGSERQAEWNACWFEEVIRARYNEGLTTHLATNQSLDGKDGLFVTYPWLKSIARDMFMTVEVKGVMR